MYIFAAHMNILRLHIFYTVLAFLSVVSVLIGYSQEVLLVLCRYVGYQNLIYTGILEPVYAMLYLSIRVGLLAIFPYIVYNFWLFLVPGLFRYEKLYFGVLITAYLGMLYGALYAIFTMFPYVVTFFLAFEIHTGQITLSFEGRIHEFVAMVLTLATYTLLLVHILICLLLYMCIYPNSIKKITRKRYPIYLVLLMIFSILTPPSLISLLITILPIIALFEVMIFIGLLCRTIR